MTYTEEQLKLALIRALPDTIRITPDGCANPNHMYWLHGDCDAVTQHEWPAIVGMAFTKWIEEGGRDFAYYSFFSPIVSWQQVATYLAEIGAIKIETP